MKIRKFGFTLVELLVVITIIGVLVGLTISGVSAARERARRLACENNLRMLGLAGELYESKKGRYPGYVEEFGFFSGGVDPSSETGASVVSHRKLGTWAVTLLPGLDAQPVYEHWTEDRYPILSDSSDATADDFSGIGFHPLAAPNLAIMQCPSNPVSSGQQGKNSYAMNNGMCHLRPDGSSIAGVTFLSSQDRNNGIGNSKYNMTAVNASTGVGSSGSTGPNVRFDDLKDGAGNTLLFTENLQALPWHRAGLINGDDLKSSTLPNPYDVVFDANVSPIAESARYIHGVVWHYEDHAVGSGASPVWNSNVGENPVSVATLHRINGGGSTVSDDKFNKVIQTVQDARDLARPSSAHVGGVNAVNADGTIRFITDDIDYRIYQAMLTPRGKSSDVPWNEF